MNRTAFHQLGLPKVTSLFFTNMGLFISYQTYTAGHIKMLLKLKTLEGAYPTSLCLTAWFARSGAGGLRRVSEQLRDQPWDVRREWGRRSWRGRSCPPSPGNWYRHTWTLAGSTGTRTYSNRINLQHFHKEKIRQLNRTNIIYWPSKYTKTLTVIRFMLEMVIIYLSITILVLLLTVKIIQRRFASCKWNEASTFWPKAVTLHFRKWSGFPLKDYAVIHSSHALFVF
jgi:hypothetical protein